jgi:chromosome segregation ATPase
VAGLVESNPAEDMGWYLPVTQLPDMPHQGHLAPVLAGHEFQEAFKNYRDLIFLDHNLAEWHDRIGIYGDMLDNRRKAFAERLPQVRQRASESRLEALQRRRDGLLGEFQAAEATTDGAAYASADEQAAQAMLERAQGVLARGGDALKAEVDTEATAERLRRLQGALTWQFSQQRPERRRQAEKGLHAIEGQLAEARTHDAALAGAEKEQSAQFAGFAQRLADLDKRLQTLQPRVAALATEQQTALQDTVIVALRAQQERLVGYADQARYAVAQLYDRATQRTDQRQEGERAKP